MLLSLVEIDVLGSTSSLNVRSLPMSAMGRLFFCYRIQLKKDAVREKLAVFLTTYVLPSI